jgi:hypothetical protein
MLRTIDYADLDDDTKSYLREVRNARGEGSPGVFRSAAAGKPGCALLIGLIVLPLFVWAGYSSNKNPWANAMIQTAGVMLGGWLVLYAFRRWTAHPDKYVGKFFYFDPAHVYIGDGEQLRYARLSDDTSAEPVGQNGVRFETYDTRFQVSLPDRLTAVTVANYYDALDHLRRDDSGQWNDLTPAESGAVARYMVRNDSLPPTLSETELAIEDLPREVRPQRRGGLGFLRYLLILAVGAGVFFAFGTTNGPIQDEGNFAAVKDSNSPAKLRDYLLNPNNTNAAHREEVTKKLAELYDKPVADVRAKGTDKELTDGFARLLDSLRGPDTPGVSLNVTDKGGAAMPEWPKTLRTRLADGIGNAVGKEFVVFVEKPTDKPALIEVSYAAEANRVNWTVEFRLKPEDESPYLTVNRSNTLTVNNPNGVPLQPTEAVYQDLMMRMLGTAPAAPPPLQLDDW